VGQRDGNLLLHNAKMKLLGQSLTATVSITALVASAIAQTVQGSTQSDCTSLETICPAKSSWEIEAEPFQTQICPETRWGRYQVQTATPEAGATPVVESVPPTETVEVAGQATEQDHDTDSLLDSASFLSFEDWKKQNLANAGQSAENVGASRRAAAAGKEGRRQPGINNALDSLGDDGEIELDFGGFGAETPEASPTAWGTPIPTQYADGSEDDRDDRVPVIKKEVRRRKDAGTTCKERFNYASFDCAATVLKTNPECKGSSSVLLENKDSYMLNECRAQNKFLILELCDDILVDTVVLANYEFFSSIFHTFRVSVSDRYPAKPDQWKELGVYEARNTREVQAFAVENSLIWARYLRIEFLTHYGHEFFCPVSLIRVHGTTMMEEYKHDESGRVDDEEVVESVPIEELPADAQAEKVQPPVEEAPIEGKPQERCPNHLTQVEAILLGLVSGPAETCGINDIPAKPTLERTATNDQPFSPPTVNSTVTTGEGAPATQSGSSTPPKAEDTRKLGESPKAVAATPDASVVPGEPVQQDSAVDHSSQPVTKPKEEQNSATPESTRPTSTQPPPSNPTTQESFFKSVHKRLQMLETNSTLSLLYIEEQSRILRDAFNKVEKRQLSKTSNFLENLNVTVLNELKEFREQYDHVWKSVAFEFEHQRVRYQQEVTSISSQLGVLADELVFQKRVTVIQSIMVLCCFALVLFSRGSVSNYMEFPRVQRMVNRSYSLRSSSPIFASPSASPGSTRPASSHRETGHRRNLSDSSSSQDSPTSPRVQYIPPTPTSDVSHEVEIEDEKANRPATPDSMTVPTLGTPQFRSRSTPPVLGGHMTDLGLDGAVEDETLMEPQSPEPND
jgi:rubredoxin